MKSSEKKLFIFIMWDFYNHLSVALIIVLLNVNPYSLQHVPVSSVDVSTFKF